MLVNAEQVRELFDASPLITASLHRLLLALLWRCFPLRSLAEWKTLWLAGRFDEAKLGMYFDQWHERFDLLHPEKPFYQRGDFSSDKKSALKKLVNEFASGSNGTLFDHSWDKDRPAINAAVAARWLVASQCFGLGGGQSFTGLNFTDCPWTRGAIILFQGNNLFETLSFNLLSLINPNFPGVGDDKPVWELQENWQPKKNQQPNGLSNYLTWQSRSVRLALDEKGALRECDYAQGNVLAENFKSEPMYAYHRSDQAGFRVWQFDKGKVMWRDSHSLFDLSAQSPLQLPAAFNFLARLSRDGVLDKRRPCTLHILGQCTQSGKAIVHFWRSERLPLTAEYLIEKKLLDKLGDAITVSNKVVSILDNSVEMLARNLLKFISDRKPEQKDVQQMAAHLQTESFYWSQLETHFKRLLTDLPNDRSRDEDGETVYGNRVLADWSRVLRSTANEAFHIATRSLDGSSRALKAVAIAQGSFNKKIHETLGSYLNKESANNSVQPQEVNHD
jgi:CRISPR system Cascade subunit CasA